MRRVGAPHRGGERSAEEGGEDRPAGELAPILYVDAEPVNETETGC